MTSQTPRTASRDRFRTRVVGALGSLALLAALVGVAQAMGITSRTGFKLLILLVIVGCVAILVVPELFRPRSSGKRKHIPSP